MSMQVPSLETAAVRSSIRPAANEEVFFDVESLVENFDVLVASHGGPDQVRRLVVELAVRGRLTNAQSGDDDVEMLIVRIARDVGDRAAKYPPVEAADEPFTIPAHWKWVRWGHLSTGTSSGWSPQCENRSRGDNEWGVLKVSAVSWNQFNPEENKALPKGVEPRPEFAARSGDFLMSRANTAELVGRCVIVGEQPERLLLSDKIVRCEFSSHVEKRYVALFNRSMCARAHYVTHASGTSDSMKNISRDVILGMAVPLPPLAEQERIVAKVDHLMALCDDLEARQNKKREVSTRLTKSALEALTTAEGPEEFDAAWKRVVENFDVLIDRAEKLEELRTAVVDIASRGRLVRSSESGSVTKVLDERRRQRRKQWEALEIEKLRRSGRAPKGEKWKDNYEEPIFETAGLPELPEGWAYAPIALLGADLFNPVQTGPFGAQLHASEFVPSGTPVIAVGNLTGTGFTRERLYFVTSEKATQLCRYDVQAGDLLFARSGATLGKVCVAPEYVRDWRMTGHILRVRLDQTLIRSEIAALWLWASASVKAQVFSTVRGGTRPGYNTSLLESIVLPIPPIDEQLRIIERIARLTALCDDVEAKLRRAEDRASKLVEAVVSELVA